MSKILDALEEVSIAAKEYQRGRQEGYRAGIEAAAKVVAELQKEFGTEEYSVGQPHSSFQERFACKLAIERITALLEKQP